MHLLSMTYMPWLNIATLGALHDELIRDILVAGIRDKRLSERLQMDGSDLTLEKALTCIRQSEMVHQQQVILRGDETRQFPVDAVKTSKRPGKSTSNTGRGEWSVIKDNVFKV